MDTSALSKMQHLAATHYWEAKQTFLKKIKEEDASVVASDSELDAKLELLKSIDETNQNLLTLLDLYQDRTFALASEECLIGRFLRECGKVDPTEAGNLMASSGKTLQLAGHQLILIRNILVRMHSDVQTFQYRAVTDTFDTVGQLEKSRNSYRAALLWMKDLSKQLDPESNQIHKFKKVQNQVRKTKKDFEKLKVDAQQKIDLLSTSRCNLFSNAMQTYQTNLENIWSKSSKVMNIFVETFQSPQNYEFTMLKELNSESNKEQIASFEARLKEILAQDNLNEKDMLVFFEADYSDEKKTPQEKKNSKERLPTAKESTLEARNNKKGKKDENESENRTSAASSLLDLNFERESHLKVEPSSTSTNLVDFLEQPNHFMPSSLIDLSHMQAMDNEDLKSDFDQLMSWPSHTNEQATKNNASADKDKNTNLQSWLNLFSDIDPLSNPEEFDKFSSEKNQFDRNC